MPRNLLTGIGRCRALLWLVVDTHTHIHTHTTHTRMKMTWTVVCGMGGASQ